MHTATRVNVAPSSDNGHVVTGQNLTVVNLDEASETFFVNGPSVMETANHTSLKTDTSSVVICQKAYNPMSRMHERVRD